MVGVKPVLTLRLGPKSRALAEDRASGIANLSFGGTVHRKR